MSDDEKEVERRIDVAVALKGISGELKISNNRLKTIEKRQDSCVTDRDALFKRMRQIDLQLATMNTKQVGIIRGMWLAGAGIISLVGKTIWSMLHHQPPPNIPH